MHKDTFLRRSNKNLGTTNLSFVLTILFCVASPRRPPKVITGDIQAQYRKRTEARHCRLNASLKSLKKKGAFLLMSSIKPPKGLNRWDETCQTVHCRSLTTCLVIVLLSFLILERSTHIKNITYTMRPIEQWEGQMSCTSLFRRYSIFCVTKSEFYGFWKSEQHKILNASHTRVGGLQYYGVNWLYPEKVTSHHQPSTMVVSPLKDISSSMGLIGNL